MKRNLRLGTVFGVRIEANLSLATFFALLPQAS